MNERELGRGIVHILFGIAFVILIIFDLLKVWHLAVLVSVALILAFLSREIRVPLVSFFLHNFERRDARLPGKNFIFFLAGILLAFALFPKDVCLASIAILTFADPVSHFIGENFGRISIFGKNIEGHLAGFIAGSLFAIMFVKPLLAFIGCFFGVLAELITIKIQEVKIDDDLVIPVVAGLAMVLAGFL
jgi:dolichol kinase